MKKIILSSLFVLLSVSQMFAMSNASMRNHARFLTDRMAYELDLTPRQYDDLYEINLDFIYMADRIMDDVVYGYRDAIDRYAQRRYSLRAHVAPVPQIPLVRVFLSSDLYFQHALVLPHLYGL